MRLKKLIQTPLAFHAYIHAITIQMISSFLNGPLNILLAEAFSVEGSNSLCAGLVYNLLYQAVISEVIYLIMGPLNLRYISLLDTKIYYKYVYPAAGAFILSAIITVVVNDTYSNFINKYVELTICSAAACSCYYLQSYDYYVFFGETSHEDTGFLTSLYETTYQMISIGPAVFLASGTDVTLSCAIVTGLVILSIMQSLWMGSRV